MSSIHDVNDFIAEDATLTFDGYLRFQGFDPATLTADELEAWRGMFDDAIQRRAASPKVGLMKLQAAAGEHFYAVAEKDEGELFLTVWVRCPAKGDVFILLPSPDREWNPHASYHVSGRFHEKSHGRAFLVSQRQPLTAAFSGAEHLGAYLGHNPKTIGAICDPALFAGVVVVEPGRLGPRHGAVAIGLVEPGTEPQETENDQLIRRVFQRTGRPSVVITIAATALAATG